MRRPGRLVIVAAATALLTACTPGVRWVSPTAGGAPSPTAPDPAASMSSVDWTDCRELASKLAPRLASGVSYQCGTVTVPRDWHHPQDGKSFRLALMRVHSERQSHRIGSLVINPGGPGGSGVDTAAYLPLELPQAVLDQFDVVGFDPRGVGSSDPAVECFSDADLDTMFGADPDPKDQAGFDALAASWKRLGQQCASKYGPTLSLFATEQAARDIDAVRVALGDPKLTYLGWSYGTLLGATYAQLFPKNVRAMVLDGAVDPTQQLVAGSQSQLGGFEHAFDQFAAWCQRTSCPIGPDARAAVGAALERGRTDPVAGPDGRKATTGWIITGVSEAMYSKDLWPVMATAIKQLSGGSARGIFQLADEYAQRDATGHYSNLFDAFTTIGCDDDTTRLSLAQIRGYQERWRNQYPLFGGSFATGMLSCAQWPAARDPYPTGPATGSPPLLVVGTVNDPATPYAQAQKLADMLGDATVLTWQGEGHTAYPQTSCVRASVDAYLIDLQVPAAGTTCPP